MTNKYPWIYEYLEKRPGAQVDFKAEWQWTRYMIDGRMFAAICKNERGEDWFITIKLDPTEGSLLRDAFAGVFPGYYMDKRHWNSVYLDGDVPDEMMRGLLNKSHALIFAKLSKRRQAEISAEIMAAKP